jgi:hypothetical protein
MVPVCLSPLTPTMDTHYVFVLLAGNGANSTAAFAFFSSVNMVLNKYNGTYPTTFIDTGLQWYVPPL